MNELGLDYHTTLKNANTETTAVPIGTVLDASLHGLVKRFKSDRTRKSRTAVVSVFADMLQVKIPEFLNQQPPGRGGIKKPITDFSRSSRRNMLNAMAQMRNVGAGYFVHLTFPGMATIPAKFVVTQESAKSALAALRKRIARRFPDAGGIWRLEPKKRLTGASRGLVVPHFHVMIFNLNWTDKDQSFRDWIAQSWNEIIDPTDTDHRKAGTRVDDILSRRHAMAYASKYTAKTGDEYSDKNQRWGRRWGVFGNIDRTPVMVFECPAEKLIQMRRDIRKFLNARNKAAWKFAWENHKKVALVPIKPARNRYARQLSRKTPDDGFSILGLGDLSSDKWENITKSTIWRMIPPLSELV